MDKAQVIGLSFDVVVRDSAALQDYVYPVLGRLVPKSMTSATALVRSAILKLSRNTGHHALAVLPETSVSQGLDTTDVYRVDFKARVERPDLLWQRAQDEFARVAGAPLPHVMSTEHQALTLLQAAADPMKVALDFKPCSDFNASKQQNAVTFSWIISGEDSEDTPGEESADRGCLPAYVDPATGHISILGKLPENILWNLTRRQLQIGDMLFAVQDLNHKTPAYGLFEADLEDAKELLIRPARCDLLVSDRYLCRSAEGKEIESAWVMDHGTGQLLAARLIGGDDCKELKPEDFNVLLADIKSGIALRPPTGFNAYVSKTMPEWVTSHRAAQAVYPFNFVCRNSLVTKDAMGAHIEFLTPPVTEDQMEKAIAAAIMLAKLEGTQIVFEAGRETKCIWPSDTVETHMALWKMSAQGLPAEDAPVPTSFVRERSS